MLEFWMCRLCFRRFLLHDRSGTYGQVEQELQLDEFPSPEELWQRYQQWKSLEERPSALLNSTYYYEVGGDEIAATILSHNR
jgi:type I restriction enzyme, R subunit